MNVGNREGSEGLPNFEPMQKKSKFDDDPHVIPAVRSGVLELDGKLKLSTGKGDHAVIKLDKEHPEIPIVCKEVEIPSGSKVLILNSQKGFLGLGLAAVNPSSQFVLYEPNLLDVRVAGKNVELNYQLENVSVLGEEDFATQEGTRAYSHVIYAVPNYSPHEVIADNIAIGASFLKPDGEFYLVTRTKSGGIRQGQMLGDVLDSDLELAAQGKGYRVYKSTPGEQIKETAPRRKITYSVLGHDVQVQTEAGLFSKDALDEGTRALLEFVNPKDFTRLLDVGSGWGAIGLTAAINNPTGQVVMMDVDTRAVRVALDNARNLNLSDRVNALAAADLREIPGNFDLILSNPPFHASEHELISLFEGVKDRLGKNGQFHFVVEKTYANKLSTLAGQVFKNVSSETPLEEQYVVYSARK